MGKLACRFPWQPKKKTPPKEPFPGARALAQELAGMGPEARVFYLFEGEQIAADSPELPTGLVVVLASQWRPEGALPPAWPVEVIPGYQRPVNWEAIQAREDRHTSRAVLQ